MLANGYIEIIEMLREYARRIAFCSGPISANSYMNNAVNGR